MRTLIAALVSLLCVPINGHAQKPTLAQRVEALENQVNGVYVEPVELKVTDQQFSNLKTPIGPLPIRINNIEPYASGSKVTLHIGNLSSGTYGPLGLAYHYGHMSANGTRTSATQQPVSHSVLQDIYPGTWGKTELLLENTPPDKFNYLLLWLTDGPSIKLRSPP